MKLHLRVAATMAVAATGLMGSSFAEGPASPVTFSKHVAPLLQQNCQQCHRPGDIAPMSLLTYQDARPWAKSIKKSVAEKSMPPFHAEKGKFPFANDISMSEEEIKTIVDWVDQGAPEGNPADLPSPLKFKDSGWQSGEPDMILQPDAEYALPGNVDDEYRCYVFASNLPQDTWMQGIEYRPGNRQVVHHIMAYVDAAGKARAKDEATPEAGYLCGMTGDAGGQNLDLLLGGWAPGTPPNIFSDGTGRLIPKGSDIVFQVHYHNETGKEQVDRSSMGFYFARNPIKAKATIGIVGSYALKIPAGDANAMSQGRWRAPYDIHLLTVMPHMHYLGKDMTVTATFPDGQTETLVSVPRFDFNWQMVYAYKEPLLIPKGTTLHMVAHHDNSAENPANPNNPPKEIKWGEATDEEMAHCWLGFYRADENLGITPTPPEIGDVVKSAAAAAGN